MPYIALLVIYLNSQFTLLSYMLKLSDSTVSPQEIKGNIQNSFKAKYFRSIIKITRRLFLGLFDSRARGNDTLLLFALMAIYYNLLLPLQLSLLFVLFRRILISFFNTFTTPSALTVR